MLDVFVVRKEMRLIALFLSSPTSFNGFAYSEKERKKTKKEEKKKTNYVNNKIQIIIQDL